MAPREALASAKVSRAAGRGRHRSVHLYLPLPVLAVDGELVLFAVGEDRGAARCDALFFEASKLRGACPVPWPVARHAALRHMICPRPCSPGHVGPELDEAQSRMSKEITPLSRGLCVRARSTGKGPYGIRTRAAAVRGRCPRPLDEWAGERRVANGGARYTADSGSRVSSRSSKPRRIASPLESTVS
jgi:hypothetical protein